MDITLLGASKQPRRRYAADSRKSFHFEKCPLSCTSWTSLALESTSPKLLRFLVLPASGPNAAIASTRSPRVAKTRMMDFSILAGPALSNKANSRLKQQKMSAELPEALQREVQTPAPVSAAPQLSQPVGS